MARIMIADDNTENRMLFRDILEIEKHEVVSEAIDGADAVDLFKKTKPDLVLLDLAMPKMDGLSAIKEMMKTDQGAKIILVTASGNNKIIQDCLNSGASEVIQKPFNIKELSITINSVLSKQKQHIARMCAMN